MSKSVSRSPVDNSSELVYYAEASDTILGTTMAHSVGNPSLANRPKGVKKLTLLKKPRAITDLLELSNSPDLGVAPRSKCLGLHTKLPLFKFLEQLFFVNEDLPGEKKKTDTALAEIILEEFPNWPPIVKMMKTMQGIRLVQQYRSYYNCGRLSYGLRFPERVSFRYNDKGIPVNPRTYRPLSPTEMRDWLKRARVNYRTYLRQLAKKNGKVGLLAQAALAEISPPGET